MRDTLVDSLKESTQSVLPICAIVFAFSFILPLTTMVLFLTGATLLVIGLSIFTLGSDMAMIPMGEAISSELTRPKRIDWIAGGGSLIGVVVTIAEPDLQALAKQVPTMPDDVLVGAVVLGAGFLLVLALLRIVFQIGLAYMFTISYALIFLVVGVFSPDFLAVAFDSGGVTTGLITVPFILALSMDVSTTLSEKSSEEGSSDLCTPCSIGLVPAVLIIGIFYDSPSSGSASELLAEPDSLSQIPLLCAVQLVVSLTEVVEVLLPIMTIFILLQILRLRLSRTRLAKIFVGAICTILGLSVFLTGVNVGLMPIGRFLDGHIAKFSHNWVLVPFSAVLGFFIIAAEPTIHVLNKQAEDIISGTILRCVMQVGPSVGVSLATCLSIIRIMHQIDIWYFLLPGYAIALLQTHFTPKISTTIVFDSSGMAVGIMAAAFPLPFGTGVCEALGGSIMTDVFGMVAITATLPLITIQGIGILFQCKSRQAAALGPQATDDTSDVLIIDIGLDGGETEPQPGEVVADLSEEMIPDAQESALSEQNETAAEQSEPEVIKEHGPLPGEDTV